MISAVHSNDYQASLLDSLWQNKWKMMLIFCAVMAAALGYLCIAKAKFTSEAKLFVRLGKESVALDPTATTGQVIAVQESREKEIQSVQSLIQSRSVLEQVVEKVGVHRILEVSDKKKKSWMPIDLKYVKSFSPFFVDSPNDAAIEKLEKGLEIYSPRNTAIVGMRYEGASPELAAEILQKLIESSIDAQVRVHQSMGSSNFFITQSDRLNTQVADLEDELLQLKNASGISDLVQQKQVQISQIAMLENSLLETTAQFDAIRAEIESRKKILGGQPNQVRLSETTGLPSSAAEGMREQVFALQLTEKELLSRLQADHPSVKNIQRQIATAKEAMQTEGNLTQITLGPNESRRVMESALLNQSAIADSLAAKIKTLNGQISEAHSALKAINQNETKLSQLTRKLELSRASHHDYAIRSEQARIDQAMSEQNLSNLSVLQAPSKSRIPSNPKIALVLAMAATLGTFLSMLIAFLPNAIHRRLYESAHFENSERPYFSDGAQLAKRRTLAKESNLAASEPH